MSGIIEHYQRNTAPGPWHEPESVLPEAPPQGLTVRAIAYYLPQFHRDPVNDHAWGTGFTEWTNVTRALPRVAGQVQPRLPADLGFYDLARPETLSAQAVLARRAGIHGFCIHDYWFSGTKVLARPLEILLDTPDIDLRFCLNWANENWTRRWDGAEHEVILAQKHEPGEAEAYLRSVERALRDPRYIRVDDRPLLMIYRPGLLPDAAATVAAWREEARRLGIGEIYVTMPQGFGDMDPRPYGMDAVAGFPPHRGGWETRTDRRRERLLDPDCRALIFSYDRMAERTLADPPTEYRRLPGVAPSWDNEARRLGRGSIFLNASPAKYGWWLRGAGREALRNPEGERVVFINAWNEWAEGAILEPDRHYGYAWLAETRRALEDLAADPEAGRGVPLPADDRTPAAFLSRPHGWRGWVNYLVNRARALGRRAQRRLRRAD